MHFDYIIAGTGLAGLSLALALMKSGLLENRILLLIDPDNKTKNDRTWCFWEKTPGPFESIVYHQWEDIAIHGGKLEPAGVQVQMAPYRYKLIRGIDFYDHCWKQLQGHPNIYRLEEGVTAITPGNAYAQVATGQGNFTGTWVFSSLYAKPAENRKTTWLLQHFKGWTIETATPGFLPRKATLMDFRTDQTAGTSFFYVLPFSPTKALVEYTVFSETLLPPEAYDVALDNYIRQQLGLQQYSVKDTESGVIPMTDHRFPAPKDHVIPLGTAAGLTKGSSGYTFKPVQKHTAAIVQSLRVHGHPYAVPPTPARFLFYDRVLLRVLKNREVTGAEVFTTLFQKNSHHDIFPFLDNESNIAQELKIVSSLPAIPFAKAALGW